LNVNGRLTRELVVTLRYARETYIGTISSNGNEQHDSSEQGHKNIISRVYIVGSIRHSLIVGIVMINKCFFRL